MAYQNILIPYDGSEHAKSALALAKGLMNDEVKTNLHVIKIVPMSAIPGMAVKGPSARMANVVSDYDSYTEYLSDALQDVTNEMAEELQNILEDVSADQIIYKVIAHPAAAQGITEYADENNCDLIIMGRRGLGAIRGLLGSVSYGVLRATDVPVMTVK